MAPVSRRQLYVGYSMNSDSFIAHGPGVNVRTLMYTHGGALWHRDSVLPQGYHFPPTVDSWGRSWCQGTDTKLKRPS
jgi:hypothetical protein